MMSSTNNFCLLLLPVNSKFPYFCGCGYFIKYKEAKYYHRKKCSLRPTIKTKDSVTIDVVFDLANMRLSEIEDNFRNDWAKRFGSVTNCPIK